MALTSTWCSGIPSLQTTAIPTSARSSFTSAKASRPPHTSLSGRSRHTCDGEATTIFIPSAAAQRHLGLFSSGERDGVSYAVRHEQDLPKRPLRCRVGSSPTVPTAPISAWKAPPPLSPHRPQRDLLSPAHRLCVEISAERIPTLANR